MPCDTISTVSVKWTDKNTSIDLLKAAMNALNMMANIAPDGKTIVFSGGTFANGQFNFTSTYWNKVTQQQASEKMAEIKRHYSEQVVLSQAKKFGWGIKKTGPFKYEFIKQ